MLLEYAHEWILEEEHESLANRLRPHLHAAAKVLETFAERNRELIALYDEYQIEEIDETFARLRDCLP